jgi:ComF family protein
MTVVKSLRAGILQFGSLRGRSGHALLRSWARRALPQSCELCAANSGTRLVCPACEAALPQVAEACPRCALPSAGGAVCGSCLVHPPPYDAVIAAYTYAFPVDRLLQALKYGGRLALADWAAQALASRLRAMPTGLSQASGPAGALVPLPLAAARQRQRGFNQAQEIARHLSAALGLPVDPVLCRPRAAPPQASLPWSGRRRNVRGAFALDRPVPGGHFVVIDDVMTTGATLAEAARALKHGGAARVDCWVVARTLPPGPM